MASWRRRLVTVGLSLLTLTGTAVVFQSSRDSTTGPVPRQTFRDGAGRGSPTLPPRTSPDHNSGGSATVREERTATTLSAAPVSRFEGPLSPELDRALSPPVTGAKVVAEGEVGGGGLWRLWSYPDEKGDDSSYCLYMRVFARGRGGDGPVATGGGSGNCDYRRSMKAGGEPFSGQAVVWYGGYSSEMSSVDGVIDETAVRAIETLVAPIPDFDAVAFVAVMPDQPGTHRLIGRDPSGTQISAFAWPWTG